MDYVYDIVLNLQPTIYEYYEWQPTDKIINFKRLPIYKISNQDYLNIKYSDTFIEKNSLPKNNKIFLITSGLEIIGILINENGKVIKKSSLIYEENDDILTDINDIKIVKIKYQIIKKHPQEFQSRLKKERRAFINNRLNNLDKEKDKYYLKYLYYDIFNVDEPNIDIIYRNLKALSHDNPLKLYEYLNKVDLEIKRKNLSK